MTRSAGPRLLTACRGNVWQRIFATDNPSACGYVGTVTLARRGDGLTMMYGMGVLDLVVFLGLSLALFLLVVYLVARILRHVFRRD